MIKLFFNLQITICFDHFSQEKSRKVSLSFRKLTLLRRNITRLHKCSQSADHSITPHLYSISNHLFHYSLSLFLSRVYSLLHISRTHLLCIEPSAPLLSLAPRDPSEVGLVIRRRGGEGWPRFTIVFQNTALQTA